MSESLHDRVVAALGTNPGLGEIGRGGRSASTSRATPTIGRAIKVAAPELRTIRDPARFPLSPAVGAVTHAHSSDLLLVERDGIALRDGQITAGSRRALAVSAPVVSRSAPG